MFRKQFLIALASTTLLAFTVLGADKPNLTGTWKFVADKSDFGPMPAPEKLEQTYDHKDPVLKVTTVQTGQQGESKAEFSYSTDGKETTNEFRGTPMKCTAKWNGDKLNIVSKLDFQGNEITMNDTMSVSEDGKTLLVERKLNTPQGDLEMKIVMAKQ